MLLINTLADSEAYFSRHIMGETYIIPMSFRAPPHTPNSGDATADTALVVQQSGSAVYSPVHWRPTDSSSDRRQAWPMLVAVLRSTDPRERFVQYVNQTALRDEAAVVESLLGGSELTLYLLVAELTCHVTHRRQLQTHNRSLHLHTHTPV